ncbi:hypothetical protein SNEBB_005445 [Seison nebaliae]|nr:hypothetical protein SNEBB_005445 [Seison nebaliae]
MSNSDLQAADARKRKVSYYYDADVGNHYYGQGHPMKPHRIRMAHNLILNYGLYRKMEVYRPTRATFTELTAFHTDEYIKFLRSVRPDNLSEFQKQMQKFNVGEDCPVFDGMFDFCQISAGGSLSAAVKLNRKETDIAINWAGGLHHTKKAEASGFCYVNDIVLAILEMLKYHKRVLYIDIDIHHGDGVEEAFYLTDRVMTLSFHKYGEYFPGTGDLRDVGASKGKYYAINFPLRDGMNDISYESIFKPVTTKVIEFYQPDIILMQCGADSLTGDRLGCFNLTVKGHGACVRFIKTFNIPMLVVGGGGYTIRNVARAWTYETGICVGTDLADTLPYNDYFEYFSPEFNLHISPSNASNQNTPDYLQKIMAKIFENLEGAKHAPSVQMQDIPDSALVEDQVVEPNPDVRVSQDEADKFIEPENEFFDGDSDNVNENIPTVHEDGESQSTEDDLVNKQVNGQVVDESMEVLPENDTEMNDIVTSTIGEEEKILEEEEPSEEQPEQVEETRNEVTASPEDYFTGKADHELV